MGFDHFSHDHSLIRQEEAKENDDKEVVCYGCNRPIFKGPYYICGECQYFMHTSCAELPREMQHWMHPKHPLTLIVVNRAKWGYRCEACCKISNLAYNCSICKFSLDLRCISFQKSLKHCAHEHPFTLVMKPIKFRCDACGEKSKGMSYSCFTCQLFVHLECASLPSTIKLSDHIHTLTLTYSTLGNYFLGECRCCNKRVKTRGIYRCADCSYVAHVDCTSDERNEAAKLMRKSGEVRQGQPGTERVPEIVNQSASLPGVIKHCIHEHPLRLMLNNAEFTCDACGELAQGSLSYICPWCQFWVHWECASLPRIFKSTYHDHLFTLASFELNDSNVCTVCNGKIQPGFWAYCCAEGDYLAHVRCAKEIIRNSGIVLVPTVDPDENPDSYFLPDVHKSIDLITKTDVEKLGASGGQEVSGELKHFSHPHCLTLCESMENDGKCHGCADALSGPSYTCAKCGYFLHKSCAELPIEILEHPLHPQHPLTLLANPPYANAYCHCDACNQSFRHFAYHCSLCEFDLDVRCVSLPCVVEHHIHDHPLTLLQKISNFSCYACGMEGNGLSYLCTVCLILFHLECASSPNTIRLNSHDHCFRLCLTLDSNPPNEALCVVCDDRVRFDRVHYFCEELYCPSAAHLRCATSKRSQDASEYSSLDPSPVLDESLFLTKDHGNHSTGDETIVTELRHFSHPHLLTLGCDELRTGEKCNGCTQPISGPFYSCSECSFFLDISCTQLRSEIRHSIHTDHRLKLFAKHPSGVDGLFKCFACDLLGSGFTYCCKCCNIEIDIVCASILGDLKIKAHEHVLTLRKYTYRFGLCSACGTSCNSSSYHVWCSVCYIKLHLYCAKLPQTVWHKIHRHPFSLTYIFNEDDSGEYYCDICEEEQNPRQWFYNCADCEYPAHVRCMVGRYQRLKMGATLEIEDHPHKLVLMQLKSEDEEEGDEETYKMRRKREDVAYCCALCNFIMKPVRKVDSNLLSY